MFPLPPMASVRKALQLGLLALVACGRANSEGPGEAQGEGPALVVTEAIRPGELVDSWTFVGEVRPLLEARLAAGAAGEVREVRVREGDKVVRGQALLQLDSRLARARLAAAQAGRSQGAEELEQARRDLERAQRLGETILPEAEIEQDQSRATALQSRREQLKATEQQVREELRLHKVDAPFDGVVAARHVDPGDWVQPGDPVLDLVASERVEVLVNASVDLVAHIGHGDRATLQRGGEQVEAEVLGVVPALDPITRTIKVRLVPVDEREWLLPGLPLDVVFSVDRSGEGVVVSRDALVVGPVNTRVVRVVDGKAELVVVQVVATADDRALVRGQGLVVGDPVVVRGNERLRPGQDVMVAENDG